MSKALQSLTAQYTDSENEGEVEKESPDSSNSQASQVKLESRPTRRMTVCVLHTFSSFYRLLFQNHRVQRKKKLKNRPIRKKINTESVRSRCGD